MDASEIDSSKAGALVGTISTLSSKNKIEEMDLTIRKSLLQLKRKTVRLIK